MGAIVAEPGAICVSLAELKAFLRIASSEEEALFAGLLRSATEMCEAFTGRALIERAVTETLAASGAWTRLGLSPVRAIEGAALLSADGSAVPLAAQDYAIDIDAAGEGWVRLTGASSLAASGAQRRLRVSYRAGMAADANGVPESLRHGIVKLAGHLLTHRDSGPNAATGAAPPAAVSALWRPWRRLRLG